MSYLNLVAKKQNILNPQIESLTGFRSILIVWVVLYHFKEDLAILYPRSLLIPFMDLGFLGVDFFFILSGFIITYNYSSKLTDFNLNKYFNFLWMRLARLYPTHVFTLFISVILILLASISGSQINNPERYTLGTFIQNLLLIHAWSIPTQFSWNAISWAVSSEWLAYIIFPLIIVISNRVQRKPILLILVFISLLLTAIICQVLNQGIVITPYQAGGYGMIRAIGEFTAGCLLLKLYRLEFGINFLWKWLTPMSISLVIGVGSWLARTSQIQALWITPICAVVIYSLSWEQESIARMLRSKPFIYFGERSYALYMTHFTCLIILRRVIPVQAFVNSNDVSKLLLILGYVVFMGLFAIVTFALI